MLLFLFNLLILILFRDERSKKLDDVGDEHDKETSKEGEKQNLEVSHRCCWPMTVFAVITRNFQQTLLEIMYLIFDTAAPPPGSDAALNCFDLTCEIFPTRFLRLIFS